MKKLLLIAAAALVSLAASAQDQKLAHVDFQAVVFVVPEYAQAMTELAVAQKDAQDNLDEMLEEYQKKVQAYEKNQSTWSQTVRESKEKELTNLQQRIQEFQQDIQQELQTMQQQKIAPVQQKVSEAINAEAKKAGFLYVFDRSTMIYIDETNSQDLTQAVRTALEIPDDRTIESVQTELQAKIQELGLN